MQFQNILCVCTGNICRSPLAQGLIKQVAPGLNVDSAGIAAVAGGRMPEEAAAIAAREGLPIQDHRGKQLTAEHAEAADVILVMEKEQLDWIGEQFPQVRGRIFRVTHWSDGEDVADPYRHDAAFFEQVYAHLTAGVRSWVVKLGIGA
jgi:protein-tyrosine phosphatase